MAALTADRDTPERETPKRVNRPVAASTTLYSGGLVGIDASGNAVPGAATRALKIIGIAAEQVDNSTGSAGDKSVEVKAGIFRLANGDSITDADIGQKAYASDDQTVNKSSAANARPEAGTIVDTDASGVWVSVGLEGSAVRKGSVLLSLFAAREVDANGDVGNLVAHGGQLASDSTPILRGDAAESQELSWATGNTDKIAFHSVLPADFDGSRDVEVSLWVYSGTTDAATFTVETGWDGGALVSDTADDSATKSATVHKVTATVAAADVADSAHRLTVILTPGAHATDAIQLVAARVDYAR